MNGNDTPYGKLRQRHLRFGWSTLLVFAALGAALEVLHALKLGLYLDVGNETRRLMWRLAHAHGVLLGLVNVAFALTLAHLRESPPPRPEPASACLVAATCLLPLGFLLGGAFVAGGDPGPLVLLVPLGIPLLLATLWWTASSLR
ncbi:MAG: hypothetical protein RL685_2128 [Pseudomonadota bacterium]|jgi:hypothetical protein